MLGFLWQVRGILLFSLLVAVHILTGAGRKLVVVRPETDGLHENEVLTVYDVTDEDALEHLKPTDVDRDWIPRATALPIDLVHRLGLLHTGHWLFVVDGHGRILFLKRQPFLVTCPNAWMPLGEHSKPTDSEPIDSAKRGIEEELGGDVLKYHVDFIRALGATPIYDERDYGPSNGGRMDRQAVYNWWVQLKKDVDGTRLVLDLDHEVAAVRWMAVNELEGWIEDDWKLHTRNLTERDTLLEGRLCHVTILELLEAALVDLKKHL